MKYVILYHIEGNMKLYQTLANDTTLENVLHKLKKYNDIYKLRVYPLGVAMSKYNVG